MLWCSNGPISSMRERRHLGSHSTQVHSVHFYDSDAALIHRLQSVTRVAVEAGDSVIVLATEEHRRHLNTALAPWSAQMHSADRSGRLLVFDAEQTLDRFLIDGQIDDRAFDSTVGALVRIAKQTSLTGSVTAFGEMVAIASARKQHKQAIDLERAWNDLLAREAGVHLHCAYHHLQVSPEQMREICEHHTYVLGSAAA